MLIQYSNTVMYSTVQILWTSVHKTEYALYHAYVHLWQVVTDQMESQGQLFQTEHMWVHSFSPLLVVVWKELVNIFGCWPVLTWLCFIDWAMPIYYECTKLYWYWYLSTLHMNSEMDIMMSIQSTADTECSWLTCLHCNWLDVTGSNVSQSALTEYVCKQCLPDRERWILLPCIG